MAEQNDEDHRQSNNQPLAMAEQKMDEDHHPSVIEKMDAINDVGNTQPMAMAEQTDKGDTQPMAMAEQTDKGNTQPMAMAEQNDKDHRQSITQPMAMAEQSDKGHHQSAQPTAQPMARAEQNAEDRRQSLIEKINEIDDVDQLKGIAKHLLYKNHIAVQKKARCVKSAENNLKLIKYLSVTEEKMAAAHDNKAVFHFEFLIREELRNYKTLLRLQSISELLVNSDKFTGQDKEYAKYLYDACHALPRENAERSRVMLIQLLARLQQVKAGKLDRKDFYKGWNLKEAARNAMKGNHTCVKPTRRCAIHSKELKVTVKDFMKDESCNKDPYVARFKQLLSPVPSDEEFGNLDDLFKLKYGIPDSDLD